MIWGAYNEYIQLKFVELEEKYQKPGSEKYVIWSFF